ncbi:MAG TPA: hypothetical protein DDY70_04580 [Clostridiales bacterium]|nr:hypothetical protein [Clostridiales bacterium]
MLTLFTDTDNDFTPKLAREYGYHLISMPFTIDGELVFPYEDGDDFDMKSYYAKLRAGTIPTTTGLSAERYKEYFRPEFEKGNDILYVHFSAAMSGTFDAMREALADLLKEFPDRKFYGVDTKGITIVAYLVAREIGDMFLAGKPVEEIMAWADREIDCFSQYFFADDLKFFRRSGRVSGISATMGTLLGIRPIIYMNAEGKMVSHSKERGREHALTRLVSFMEEMGDDISSHRVIIGHTDAPELAAELEKMIRDRFGDLRIETVCTNPTAGAHCGPNGVGVAFHSKHR